VISVLQSFLPLVLLYLLKLLIDEITLSVSSGTSSANIIPMIVVVVVIFFLDEISSDFGNFVRKKQSVKLEEHMYGLLHSKAVRLDLINFEHPGYFDCLARATSEAPWRPNSILNNIISMFHGLLSLVLMAGLLLTLHKVALLLVAVNIPSIWLGFSMQIYFIISRGPGTKPGNQSISTGCHWRQAIKRDQAVRTWQLLYVTFQKVF
jgi:ATP-binding cassette subfamily B protein